MSVVRKSMKLVTFSTTVFLYHVWESSLLPIFMYM